MSMYVDFDLLVYVGAYRTDCTPCKTRTDHDVEITRDRVPWMLVRTCHICHSRRAHKLGEPVDVPEPAVPA